MDGRQAVGIVGIGAMGGAMARRLVQVGWPPRVCDIDPVAVAAAEALGLEASATPASLAACCEVVLVVVVDAPQIEAVLFGAEGVVQAPPPAAGTRRTVVLCSTIAPDDTEAFAARLAAQGIDTIDAPISGGPARAEAGQMSMMVAATASVQARCARLLGTLASALHPVGERIGDGARMKLVNNLLAGVNLAAAAEAMALGARMGLDPRRMFELVQVSSGASWILADRMPRALAGDLAPRARTTLLAKDLGLAVRMAEAAGAHAPLGRDALASFRAAVADGRAGLDDASLLDLGPSPGAAR